jgi:hypothetical protein
MVWYLVKYRVNFTFTPLVNMMVLSEVLHSVDICASHTDGGGQIYFFILLSSIDIYTILGCLK